MIAGHIEDLIKAAKELPNSMHRNKIVSHLQDARAHAIVLENVYPPKRTDDVKDVRDKIDSMLNATCLCPHYPEAIAADCPVHGAP